MKTNADPQIDPASLLRFGQKYRQYTREEVRREWIGDAALTMLARIVISERFPHLPITPLNATVQKCVTNEILYKASTILRIPGGADGVERHIYDLVLKDMVKAKRTVAAIIELVAKVDWAQLREADVKAAKWKPPGRV